MKYPNFKKDKKETVVYFLNFTKLLLYTSDKLNFQCFFYHCLFRKNKKHQ